jgi:hypothetical protein
VTLPVELPVMVGEELWLTLMVPCRPEAVTVAERDMLKQLLLETLGETLLQLEELRLRVPEELTEELLCRLPEKVGEAEVRPEALLPRLTVEVGEALLCTEKEPEKLLLRLPLLLLHSLMLGEALLLPTSLLLGEALLSRLPEPVREKALERVEFREPLELTEVV